VARNAALVIAGRYDRSLEQLRARSFLDVEATLALRLTRLLDAHGVANPGGGRALPFRISQEELGQLIGATREAVGRSLRAWEKRGWVDLGYAHLVVRRPKELAALFEAQITPAARA
jgi:CRP-like cAMP-binding protein